MQQVRLYFLMAVLFSVVVSCVKTEENQKKRWTYNMERIELVEQKHPNFKSIITKLKRDAEKLFAEALVTIDDELKVKLMSEACDDISPSFVRELADFDKQATEARELIKKIMERSDSNTSALIAAISGMNIEQDISDARETIRTAQPTNLVGANRIVKDAVTPLEKNIKDMKDIIRQLDQQAREEQ